MKTSVLVVGAGAAGMLAAGFAGAGGADTVLLERNDRPGRRSREGAESSPSRTRHPT